MKKLKKIFEKKLPLVNTHMHNPIIEIYADKKKCLYFNHSHLHLLSMRNSNVENKQLPLTTLMDQHNYYSLGGILVWWDRDF